jgi:probable phosphoglycerate mutase
MKTPTHIILVRHGTTPTTGKVLPGRRPGLNLSEKGLDDAKKAGKIIFDAFKNKVAAVYSSPLERALQTAEQIAAILKKEVIIEDKLIECDFGKYTGRNLKDLYKIKNWDQLHKNPASFRFPDGESFLEMEYRMKMFLDYCLENQRGKSVVLVSHADPIKILVNFALGMHLNCFQRLVITPASITVLSYPEPFGLAQLLALNLKSSLKESIGA